MMNPDGVKENFCEDLETLIISVLKEDKFIILGDFKARAGTDYQMWQSSSSWEEWSWKQQ